DVPDILVRAFVRRRGWDISPGALDYGAWWYYRTVARLFLAPLIGIAQGCGRAPLDVALELFNALQANPALATDDVYCRSSRAVGSYWSGLFGASCSIGGF